jgi:uridine phosphorylase
MTPCVINPQRNNGEPQLPPVGILAVNPADSTCFAELAKRYGLQKHFLFNSNLYSGNSLFLAGPAVGAPMASICLEKIIAMGATQIILYGWCGSLTPSLRSGDLFMPTSSVSEEGTSVHYQHIDARVDDSLRSALLAVLTTNTISPKQGAIWTTDAVYRETREKVTNYASQGIMAVDMEYAALKAVAGFRHVHLAAVMLVSDELYHQEWTPRFVQKSFRSDSKRILDRLCALIQFSEVVPT